MTRVFVSSQQANNKTGLDHTPTTHEQDLFHHYIDTGIWSLVLYASKAILARGFLSEKVRFGAAFWAKLMLKPYLFVQMPPLVQYALSVRFRSIGFGTYRISDLWRLVTRVFVSALSVHLRVNLAATQYE